VLAKVTQDYLQIQVRAKFQKSSAWNLPNQRKHLKFCRKLVHHASQKSKTTLSKTIQSFQRIKSSWKA